ncbi:fimbrial protein [Serratia sp. UGAL515B_01]|uniref:fimbrial protein n=1 Tax=Serratia sp. UGAL515B_01 TaxID=2986763 RepID=UPI00295434F5|nr:fimbrial protein [Serratia sp. UGAL515B_01]WON78393.1 type 1 fimbrial protein [Serratia sp. UGAL515B_01]
MRRFIVLSIIFLSYTLTITEVEGKVFGEGRVHMSGDIIASACAIEAGSAFQSVNLGAIPIKNIEKEGYSSEVEFNIRLTNCELTPSYQRGFQGVRVTFDGVRSDDGMSIVTQGDAQGVGLVIKDALGKDVIPGVAQSEIGLSPGDMVLKYSLHLSKIRHQIKTGTFQANVRFMLEYL